MKTKSNEVSAQAHVAQRCEGRSPAVAKKLAMTAIAASLAFAAPVFADDAHHPEKAQEAKAAPAKPEQTVRKMQDNVRKMQGQLDRIAKSKTDDDRQKAMAEHMQTMQENMMMARGMQAGMMGCPMMEGGMMGKGGMGMMGGGMMGGGMMGGGMGMMGGPQAGGADRMQQMERRMDMMQMMMEQMMRRPDGQPQPMPEGNPRGMK
ncbi:MAG: hypothetical protein LDL44_19910 [Caenispirillum sp.]|nr:hypothetical protein [Caenispirillum sp.]